jgi:hypothetical protein
MKLKPNEVLLVEGGLGRYHYVTAIFNDAAGANAYMATAPGEAVIAVFDDIILIAAVDDLGIPLPSTVQA